MSKDMQISKLLISKDAIENNNINFQNIYNLLDFDDNYQNQNQTTSTVTTNGNYEPLQLLNYKVDLLNDDSHPISINDLRDNDRKILSLLNDEIASTYSFKALERKLNIHQQSLSRALKRLVDLDLIEKTTAGYKLFEKNNSISNAILENIRLLEEEESSEAKKTRKRFDQLIQIRIPIRYNIKLIINHLIGKWFGNLRWFGIIKKETGIILQWVAINKYNNDKLFQINVNIVSEYIVIESNAVSDKEKVEAISSSNRIVGEIIKIIQDNHQQEESEIPNEYPPIYTNNVKYNIKKNK
jgi:DNA-binding HxlR family transcriptional regulator